MSAHPLLAIFCQPRNTQQKRPLLFVFSHSFSCHPSQLKTHDRDNQKRRANTHRNRRALQGQRTARQSTATCGLQKKKQTKNTTVFGVAIGLMFFLLFRKGEFRHQKNDGQPLSNVSHSESQKSGAMDYLDQPAAHISCVRKREKKTAPQRHARKRRSCGTKKLEAMPLLPRKHIEHARRSSEQLAGEQYIAKKKKRKRKRRKGGPRMRFPRKERGVRMRCDKGRQRASGRVGGR